MARFHRQVTSCHSLGGGFHPLSLAVEGVTLKIFKELLKNLKFKSKQPSSKRLRNKSRFKTRSTRISPDRHDLIRLHKKKVHFSPRPDSRSLHNSREIRDEDAARQAAQSSFWFWTTRWDRCNLFLWREDLRNTPKLICSSR